MIIQCEKCRTKYRFDESLIVGDGVWVRCSRCEEVFFQQSYLKEKIKEEIVPPPDMVGEEEEREEEASEQEVEDRMVGGREKKGLWTPGKVVAYILIVILVLGGVYLWFFPEVSKVSYYMSYINRRVEKVFFGANDKSVSEKMEKIDFLNVKECFVKNWISGNLLVIQGVAVNKNDYSVSTIKVRGKILDTSGKVLGEAESYCGNILTDEELVNLTEKEIAGEMSIPAGSDVSNKNIAPEGNIPFMIVFTNPPKETEKFIIELAR